MTKPATPATKTQHKRPTLPAAPRKSKRDEDQSHRQRFDQLLDDVVFGKPTKR